MQGSGLSLPVDTPMRLDLSHCRQPETPFARVFQPADLPGGDEEYRVAAPVDLRMVVHKDHDRFRLVGTVKTSLELACSRCLEPFTIAVDREFDLRYLPSGAAEPGADDDEEREVEEDDVSVAFHHDDEIDLDELLRDEFYLALPMKPLCSEACRGLCPQCGANRNTAPCDCSPHWEDPRMAGLKTLLTKRKSDDA